MDTSKPMYEGNWACGQCSAPITRLPFQPDPARANQLKCSDCFKAGRPAGGGGAPRGERQMHQGSWPCSMCSNTITELPFQPRSTEGLKCRDCFSKTTA